MRVDTECDGPLPRWAGICEPMTVLTDVLLGAVAFVLAVRLGYAGAAEHAAAGVAMAAALLAAACAALLGAAAHGLDPRTDREARARMWRGALYLTGLVGAAPIVAVAFFAARGAARIAILVFAALKLVAYLVTVTRRPEFRVAAADYGGALAILLAGAAYAAARWRAPGTGWMAGGVVVSLVAGVVQARGIAPHRQFNHNDLYHVIQIAALYLFYRSGVLLVDR